MNIQSAPVISKLPGIFGNQRFRFGVIYFFFFLIYIGINWTGVTSAWWHLDDYPRMEQSAQTLVERGFINGRPLEGLWFLTFILDAGPNYGLQNVLLRIVQCGIHSLAAFLIALSLWNTQRRWSVFIAVLTFLLWPFNAEAVLWQSDGGYILAALFSAMAAYYLTQPTQHPARNRIAGCVLVILSVLSNQSAAMLGLTALVLNWSLSILTGKQPRVREWIIRIACFLLGYAIGGVASYWIAKQYDLTGRSTLTTDPVGKFSYWLELNRLFLANPGFYNGWLIGIHIILLAGVVVGALYLILKRKLGWQGASVGLVLFFTLFIIPFTAVLIVTENWPSLRVMYSAPLIIGGAWLVIDQTIAPWHKSRMIALGLPLLLLMGYSIIAQQNSAEYASVFQSDLATLQHIELIAKQENLTRVFVPTWPDYPLPDWNPYRITYLHADSKLSAFLKVYSSAPFIRLFSPLTPTNDKPAQAKCVAFCRASIASIPPQVKILEAERTLCICPQ